MIKIKKLSKSYGKTDILNDINLHVNKGEIYAILGHNGAGKTTLIRCMMELTDYTGDIEYAFPKKDLYKNVSLQMQSSVYEDGVKVFEICQLYKELQDSQVDIDELLDQFDLLSMKKRKINHLSGGEKQKLSILLTLINQPKVIIFDEITTGLDIIAKRKVWSLIRKINQEKDMTIILTSHFLDEVEALADRVLIIEQGEIHNSGRIKEIVHQTFGDRKKISFSVQAGNENEWLDRFEHITKYNDRFIVEYESEYENDILDIIKENNGSNINIKEFSFEDAFLKNLGYVIDEKGEMTYE